MNSSSAPLSFEQFLSAHMGIVRKIAATYRRSPEDRADLIQDMLAALWKGWPTYDTDRSFSTWMYRIALNVAISGSRRERHRRHEPLSEDHDGIQGADDVDFEEQERYALVARAMEMLSGTDRALLLLHLEGHNHRNIAEVLGTTDGNVAVRFSRIKTQLRRLAGTAQEADNGN